MLKTAPYETAFKLLTLGFSVIPSGAGKDCKAPAVDWKFYQNNPANEEQLERWQEELSPQLWGIVTNASVGVIEADTPEALAKLTADLGKPHVLSPRGGGHWYIDTKGHPLKTAAGILPGIDSRGVGGFINLAGKSNFGEYQVLNLPAPDTLIPFAKLPKDVLAAVNDGKPKVYTHPTNEPIAEGQRNARLTSIAGTMQKQGLAQATILTALLTANHDQCQPPLLEAEVRQIATSTSRYLPSPTIMKKGGNGYRPEIRDLAGVKEQAVRWLWYPYIPLDKLTLVEGDPGVGKSWLTLAIITALSLGKRLPNQQDIPAHGPCLLASAEDGLADTIKPRLSKMGADTRIVEAIDGLFTLDDAGFEWLETAISNRELPPILLVIDPLVAYLSGDMDINKANQARYATARLAKIADKYSIAIIAVRHLTKGGSMKPIYRGLGSIDFVASARSVLLVGDDPDAPSNRGFAHIKSNLAERGQPVGYEITDGTFYWMEHTDLTEEKILGTFRDDEASPTTEAINIIKNVLCDGPVSAIEVSKAITANCIPERALNKAKKELGLSTKNGTIYRDGKEGKKGGGEWLWALPKAD